MRSYLLVAAAAVSLLTLSPSRPPVEATSTVPTVVESQATSPVPALALAWRDFDLGQPGKPVITTGSEAISRIELLSRMPANPIFAGRLPTEFGPFFPDEVSMAAIPVAKGAVVIALVLDNDRKHYRVGANGLFSIEPTAPLADPDGVFLPADAAASWTEAHEQAMAWAISQVRSRSLERALDPSKALAIDARPVEGGWEIRIVTRRSESSETGTVIRLGADGAVHDFRYWGMYKGCCGRRSEPIPPTSIQ